MQIEARLEALQANHAGGCVIVEGEAGVGKSRLLEEVQRRCKSQKFSGLCLVLGAASLAHHTQARFLGAWPF